MIHNTFRKLLSFATGEGFIKSVIPAVVGAVASSVIGNALGGGESSGSSVQQVQQNFANPFTAGGGLFTTNFGKGVTPGALSAAANLTPEQAASLAQLQALAGQRVRVPGSGGSSFGGSSRTDYMRGMGFGQGRHGPQGGGPFFGNRPSGSSGPTFRDRGLTAADMEGIDPAVLAAFNAAKSTGAGSGKFGLDQTIADPTLRNISQLGLLGSQDFLSQLNQTDPLSIAQSQFDLLAPILGEGQERDRLALENRQYAQGRLGSTGGAQDFNALLDAQEDADRKLLFDSLGQGLATQSHLFNLGSGMLKIPLSIEQAMLQQAQVGGGLAGATNTGNISQPGSSLNPLQAVGAGLLNQGVSSLSSSLGGLFGGGGGGGNGGAPYNPYDNSINGWINTVGK